MYENIDTLSLKLKFTKINFQTRFAISKCTIYSKCTVDTFQELISDICKRNYYINRLLFNGFGQCRQERNEKEFNNPERNKNPQTMN